MTEIILKKELDKTKLKALLAFLKSWGIEAEIKKQTPVKSTNNSEFTLSAGIWSDYQIQSDKLREEAWKRK